MRFEVYIEPDMFLVVPIDSTAISLQQCQPRKKGKLIRRHQRRNRLKGNRSSYNNLRLKSTGGIGVTPDRNRAPTQLRRSGSFPNRIVIYIKKNCNQFLDLSNSVVQKSITL